MIRHITPRYVSVYVVCKTEKGPRYLLMRRCGTYLNGTWQMVTGSIELNETAAAAALREVQEETGITLNALYSGDVVETFYMLSANAIQFVRVFVAFVSHQKVTLSPTEHDAHERLSFDQAIERLIWSEQRRSIAHVHDVCVINHPNEHLKVQLQH